MTMRMVSASPLASALASAWRIALVVAAQITAAGASVPASSSATRPAFGIALKEASASGSGGDISLPGTCQF